jgi:PAS domain S-box-containing protein
MEGENPRDSMNESYQRAQEEIVRRLRERSAEQAAASLPVIGEQALRDFESSSSPMRIFDLETLRYLAVNDAAVRFYGYAREEFLNLTILDTRHPDDRRELPSTVAGQKGYLRYLPARRQVKKSGEIAMVERITQDVLFNGRRARLTLSVDVTERERMQGLLWRRKQEFESLAENLPDLIARFDSASRYVYVNAAVEKLTGRRREELLGRRQRELGLPADVVATFDGSLADVFATGRSHTIEFRFPAPAGERLFEALHVPEKDADGTVRTVLCVARDITERKKIEEDAQRQKKLQAAIIDNLPVGVFIRDAATLRYILRNRFLEKSNGYRVDTSIGKTAYDLFPREQADRTVETDRQALESGRLVEIPEQEMRGGSGEPRTFHVRKVPVFDDDGRPQLVVGIADDITERRRAEQQLRETNEFLRSVIESSHDCIKVLDLEGRLLWMSSGGRQLMEVDDVTPLLNRSYLDFWDGNQRDAALNALSAARAGVMSRFEGYCPTSKGVPKWWDEIVTPMLDADGKPERLLVVSRDITGHRRAQRSLEESEERFRQLAENIRQVFWITTLAGDKVIYVSPAFEEVWGEKRASVYRDAGSWMKSIHPEDFPRVAEGARRIAEGDSVVAEYRIIRPDGTLRWIRDRSYPMKAGDGAPLVCGIAEDITELKAAEQERLSHAMRQRDALVREVHHRIKNSLQGVVGLLRQKMRKYPSATPDIEEAIGQLQSLALVYGLQETRPDGLLSLAEITDAICSSAEKLLGGRVDRKVERASPAHACLSGAEAVSVAVALNELVFNALKHQPARAGRKRATVSLSEGRGEACIHISNRGHLPKGFDFAAGHAVGYGLGLVRTLLAPPGGKIAFNGGRDRVEVRLTLAPPLLARQRDSHAS